ncbi:MAG: GxxExxY protein [Anaerolineaceae bacterium]|nr:GxxExxY protein [Anaerolineaceae bacterium]
MRDYEHSELTRQIIGAAIEIHRHLGPGLLESTYESCLVYELEKVGLAVQKQVALPVVYKELQLPKAYHIDLLVNDQIVVELKAVDNILPVHEAQVLSYLKLSQLKVGLLLNFHVKMMKDGVRRFALK